ncbi:hypothetical protein M422DRAFT_253639 [Sphaerobolus stellatus SS14]|uniref:Uncharacterized protein n=1 Tax=Sphaerobolus stellatus (strain SS14) TaxID=990650 RepID=A0A0C9VWG4_SPHS4|nr:hypothetical protein M422DRAFT_253639 [Sphaerobolus stellatus SS14]
MPTNDTRRDSLEETTIAPQARGPAEVASSSTVQQCLAIVDRRRKGETTTIYEALPNTDASIQAFKTYLDMCVEVDRDRAAAGSKGKHISEQLRERNVESDSCGQQDQRREAQEELVGEGVQSDGGEEAREEREAGKGEVDETLLTTDGRCNFALRQRSGSTGCLLRRSSMKWMGPHIGLLRRYQKQGTLRTLTIAACYFSSACGRSVPPSTSDASPSEASRITDIVAEKQYNFKVSVFHSDI